MGSFNRAKHTKEQANCYEIFGCSDAEGQWGNS